MSQPPKNKVPPRRVSTTRPDDRPVRGTGTGTGAPNGSSRPVNTSSGRSTSARPASRSGSGYRQPSRVAAPARRDPFPYVMGGIIGALVVGLMLVVFLISSGGGTGTGTSTTSNAAAGITTLPNANNPNNSAPSAVSSVSVPGENSNAIEPTRMSIDDFLKLYNDPANRPIIVDVRAKASFDEGHIAGAINIPGPEAETHLNELPKDKLIVAYCQ
jgi:hypothetical protein